jgi:glutathione S-transferase
MRVVVVTQASDVPTKPIDGKPTYVYWNIIGLAQATRLALTCAQVDCYDVRVDAGDDRKAWTEAKPGLQDIMPFPNLPYYLDDQVQLSQSNTILRYIGQKYNLMGSAPHHTNMALDQLSDLEGQLAMRCYGQSPEAVFEWYRTHASHFLAQFVQFLGDQEFIGGSSPSVGDCKLYAFLYKLTVVQAQLGNEETAGILPSSLTAYMNRFAEIPSIQAYMATSDYMKGPLNNPSAKWRG